jgi:hypothetical protein
MRRVVLLVALTALVAAASAAYAQEEGDGAARPEAEAQAQGPSLVVRQQPIEACDPSISRLRYLEVRGAGFDAWALQRLTSSVVDVDGTSLMTWGSVWVSPDGRLTLEVNLCADPFSGRDALAPGTYALLVGPRDGEPIASTSLEIAPLPETPEDSAQMGS